MRKFSVLLVPAALIVGASCSSSTSSAPKPAAAPAPTAAAPAAARTGAPTAAAPATAQAAGRGGAQGGAAGAGGRAGGGAPPQQTPEQRAARRDSLSAKRAATVKELMASIAGKENLPAGEVFKNVQMMKTVPAGQFLTVMDQGIGRALSRDCTDCHLANDWASDSLARKKTARTMMDVVNGINTTQLTKLGPGRGGAPRSIQCVTCHRGGAAGSTALVP